MGEENNGLHRVVTGQMKVMEAVNRKLYRVEIAALNDITNRNGWRYTDLEGHLNEFKDIPILTAYVNGGVTVGDGHNFDMKLDPATGEEYPSFMAADAERIVGWVPKDANIRVEDRDGINWVVVTGYLWTWYSRELVEKIAGQGGGMEVSIETLVTAEHKEGDVDVEDSYIVLGITVLGDGVSPAVAGANIKSLAELREGMKEEVLKAASYIHETNEEPKLNDEGVKRKMPIPKRRLAEMSKSFEGFTCVGATEDMKGIALLSQSGVPYGYVFSDTDEGNVIADRVKECAVTVCYKLDGAEVEVDMDSVMESYRQRINSLEEDNANLVKANENLTNQVADMTAKEKNRRLEAARNAATDELAKLNANKPDGMRFSSDLLKDLNARIENGEYTEMVDAEGNWKGEQAVRDAVKVLCMDAQVEMDRKAYAAEPDYHTWSYNRNSANDDMTLGEKMRNGIR